METNALKIRKTVSMLLGVHWKVFTNIIDPTTQHGNIVQVLKEVLRDTGHRPDVKASLSVSKNSLCFYWLNSML